MTPNGADIISNRPILASASAIRAAMLARAGVEIDQQPADLDEAAIISSLIAPPEPLAADDIALVLAQAKAESVSGDRAGKLVIGCDQTLELEGRLFQKSATMEEARRNLLLMSGKTHLLHSAVVLALDGETAWSHVETAAMNMRDLSPEFIGRYLAQAGAAVLSSVGVYQLEGLGAQLFEKIEGDYFTILGLPLLPLLAELRRRGVIAS